MELVTPQPSTFPEGPSKSELSGSCLRFILASDKPQTQGSASHGSFDSSFCGAGKRQRMSGAAAAAAEPSSAAGSEGPGSSQLAKCRYCKFPTKPFLILLGRKCWL